MGTDAELGDGRNCGEAEDGERQDENGQHGQLHLVRASILPRNLACARPTARRRRPRGWQTTAPWVRTNAAGQDFAELDEEHRHKAPSGVRDECMALTSPNGKAR